MKKQKKSKKDIPKPYKHYEELDRNVPANINEGLQFQDVEPSKSKSQRKKPKTGLVK